MGRLTEGFVLALAGRYVIDGFRPHRFTDDIGRARVWPTREGAEKNRCGAECVQRVLKDFVVTKVGQRAIDERLGVSTSHVSSDGCVIDGPPGPGCGCQSCRHEFGSTP